MGLVSLVLLAEVGRGTVVDEAETWAFNVEGGDLMVSGVLTKPRTVGLCGG